MDASAGAGGAGVGGTGTGGTGTGGTNGSGGRGGSSGAGGAGEAGNDRCNIAIYNPAMAPQVITLTNRVTTLDPSMVVIGSTYHLFGGVRDLSHRSSMDLTNWSATVGGLLEATPTWAPNSSGKYMVAPEVAQYGFGYHAFYSYFSQDDLESNTCCIGHARSDTLQVNTFRDNGTPAFCSKQGDDYTAVFPNIFVDDAGLPWLAFGGPFTPIRIVRVDFDRGVPIEQSVPLADSPDAQVHSPFIVRRCGYYFLFVSVGRWCCETLATPISGSILVGRSRNLTGGYLDRTGKPMLEGGGTLVVGSNDRWHGVGHNAVVFTESGAYNVYRAWDTASVLNPELRIAELRWDAEGWPISGGP